MMRKVIFSLLITIIGVVASCTSDDKDMHGSIYGVVTDSQTAEPLRAIGVELYCYDGLLLKTVTYDDGHFEFDDLKPDTYGLVIVAEGYNSSEYTVVVEPGRTARADMQALKQQTYLTVSTLDVEGPSEKKITFNGYYSYLNVYGAKANEVGFIYGQSQVLDIKNGVLVKADLQTFKCSVNIEEFTNGKWYVKAYAKNEFGYEFGQIRMFEVKLVPEVKTLEVTNLTETTATLNGLIVYEGDPKYTEKGFVYSSSFPKPTLDDPDNATKKIVISGNSKEFSANVSNLTTDKIHYVRAYAKCNDGIIYGEAIAFTPSDKKPYIIIDGLAIQLYDLSSSATWQQAVDLCSTSRIGGYSDWRLPTLAELKILYNNQSQIGGFIKENYWSSVVSGSYFYYVDFSNGQSYYGGKTYQRRVRAVRTVK